MFEVFCAILRITLVNNVSITHENQFVEILEGLGRRLMNCSTDCFAMLSCDLFQNSAYFYRCKAIKS